MVLRLDPRFPAVWRTPFSLQFGVSPGAVTLHNLDEATERMLAALSSGVSRSGLAMIAHSAGAGDPEVDALLARLRPVLRHPVEREPPRVVVAGTGRLAERLIAVLAALDVQVLVVGGAEAAEVAECELAVAIGHYVLDPALHGLWLRRDVTHLPVVYGDRSIAIGPLVVPGVTACLYCLQRHATDADPAWAAIASQLWGRRSPADTELMASEAAAIVAREVLARLGGDRAGRSRQLVIDAASGARSSREVDVHPECGCVAFATANAAARPGTGSEFATGPVTSTPLPTTARAAFGRE
jgi:bacteriocin biosynthesis cyclodehydratase domain-containing protein